MNHQFQLFRLWRLLLNLYPSIFFIVLSAINNDEALLFTKQTPFEPSSKFIE